ncbi:MAG: double-CXXCG motif protein [Hyphomicrobiaceae bacterium]
MPTVYVCKPDLDGWAIRNKPDIRAAHATGVPGVDCPIEGPWTTIGPSYPTVDVGEVKARIGNFKRGPVSPAAFESLREKLRPLLPANTWLAPGTDFGPLVGSASGTIGDFGWPSWWDVVVRESVLEAMRQDGFTLRTRVAELEFRKKQHETLHEFEIWPTAQAVGYAKSLPCELCGRVGGSVPDRFAVDGRSLKPDEPFQRLVQFPTCIIANEDMASFIRSRKLTDMVLQPITVV